MGRKARIFHPFSTVTLEDLIPADHFYRQLDRSLDLALVHDLVVHCYATGGRPYISGET